MKVVASVFYALASFLKSFAIDWLNASNETNITAEFGEVQTENRNRLSERILGGIFRRDFCVELFKYFGATCTSLYVELCSIFYNQTLLLAFGFPTNGNPIAGL